MLPPALTPRQTIPRYSETALTARLRSSASQPGETQPVQDIEIDLPEGEYQGWLGLGWLLFAIIPAAVGGGVLQTSIQKFTYKG